jgi:WD40 repeat protein
MRQLALAVTFATLLCGTAIAGKPSGGGGSPPPNPQIAYEVLSGKSEKLVVSDENGTNASTLYTSSSAFKFDLAPRGQGQVAIIDGLPNGVLRLLTYAQTGTGAFATANVVTLGPARRGSSVDFSPDGTKLAYACNSNGIDSEQLCVYDLTTNTATVWGSDSFYWDLAWFRGGASIAYSTDDADGFSRLHEITGPNQTPQAIFQTKGDIYFDAARTDQDALVLDYTDGGNAFIGLWKDGSFLVPDLTHNIFAFYGELNCTDSEIVYQGPPNKTPTWYIRDLTTGLSTKFGSQSDHWVQFWPTCS